MLFKFKTYKITLEYILYALMERYVCSRYIFRLSKIKCHGTILMSHLRYDLQILTHK